MLKLGFNALNGIFYKNSIDINRIFEIRPNEMYINTYDSYLNFNLDIQEN